MENSSINRLNHFLRGEMSAVEAYQDALSKVHDETCRRNLERVEQSHERRAEMIRNRILQLGGTPAENSGMEGALAKFAESTASMFGEHAIVSTLEQGEDKGLHDYERQLPKVEVGAVAGIADKLLIEQQQTHDIMSQMKRQRFH